MATELATTATSADRRLPSVNSLVAGVAGLGSDQLQEQQRPSRIGRPKTGQSELIDQAILQAATEQFLMHGYAVASMEAIALAAGVSKRTLYARYATKELLMHAVVKDRVRTWAELASAGDSTATGDFRSRLVYFTETLIDALGSREVRAFDHLIRSTASMFPELAKAFYDVGYRYELEFLAGQIAKGSLEEGKPARDPERVARQLLSMMIGWRRIEETVREIDRDEAARFAREAVELLFDGRQSW